MHIGKWVLVIFQPISSIFSFLKFSLVNDDISDMTCFNYCSGGGRSRVLWGTNIGTFLVIGAGHGVGPGRGVPLPGWGVRGEAPEALGFLDRCTWVLAYYGSIQWFQIFCVLQSGFSKIVVFPEQSRSITFIFLYVKIKERNRIGLNFEQIGWSTYRI